MKNLKLIYKNFMPYAVALFLSIVICIFSLYLLFQHQNNNYISTIKKSALMQYDTILKRDTSILIRAVKQLQTNSSLIKEFNNLDAKNLYLKASPILNSLKKDFDINYMYFYTHNQNNFLNVQNNKKENFLVRRYTLVKSMEKNIIISGIEYDEKDGLALRVVAPLLQNKRVIGYVEVAKSLNPIFEALSKNIGNDIFITINSGTKNKLSKTIYTSSLDKKEINEKELENKILFNKAYYVKERILDVVQIYIGDFIIKIDQERSYNKLFYLSLQMLLLISLITIFMLVLHYRYIKKTNLQLKKDQRDIIRLTITDELTKLYNRRHFNKVIPAEFSKIKRDKNHIAFFIIKVDRFGPYNEEFGHHEGDLLLKQVASTLAFQMKRPTDLVFRIDAEKFAIFTSDIKEIDINKISQRLLKAICDKKIEHPDNTNHEIVTVSIGMHTQIISSNLELEDLYKTTIEALKEAREAGRNCARATNIIL